MWQLYTVGNYKLRGELALDIHANYIAHIYTGNPLIIVHMVRNINKYRIPNVFHIIVFVIKNI